MDKQVLFQALNDELEKEHLHLEIICVGGFVLEYYNLRGTQDVDAFYQEDNKIRTIIQRIGDKYGVNDFGELWLNNSVSNLNKVPKKSICTKAYQYSCLTVWIPPLMYIVGMKLESGRERDKKDVGQIIRLENIVSPKQLVTALSEYQFQPDLSVVLEVFEYAYGMEWLAEYMTEHPEEFRE